MPQNGSFLEQWPTGLLLRIYKSPVSNRIQLHLLSLCTRYDRMQAQIGFVQAHWLILLLLEALVAAIPLPAPSTVS